MQSTAGKSSTMPKDLSVFAALSASFTTDFSDCCISHRFATMFLGWSMESGPLFLELCVCCCPHCEE